MSRSFFWEPRRVPLHLRTFCCGYALSLEAKTQALRTQLLSSYRSSPKTSDDLLKSALGCGWSQFGFFVFFLLIALVAQAASGQWLRSGVKSTARFVAFPDVGRLCVVVPV